jgi:hypothetical protein
MASPASAVPVLTPMSLVLSPASMAGTDLVLVGKNHHAPGGCATAAVDDGHLSVAMSVSSKSSGWLVRAVLSGPFLTTRLDVPFTSVSGSGCISGTHDRPHHHLHLSRVSAPQTSAPMGDEHRNIILEAASGSVRGRRIGNIDPALRLAGEGKQHAYPR